jgi:predicted ATPase/class 3 adenylate cyclase
MRSLSLSANSTEVSRSLPSGTVTFLFTDIEGSTKLLHELGQNAYAEVLAKHRSVLRGAFAAHGGVEVDTQGDAFFVAFPTAPGAMEAAREAQEVLAQGPIRVRMGIHTGTPLVTDEGYVGPDVHRAARIAAAGHGGQVLVSASTAALVGTEDLRDLGEHRLKDLSAPQRIYQFGENEFPPLKSLYQTNLPIPTTPFLGRERELAEVLDFLSKPEIRLLTLTGPGGTGKTRLAAQAAGFSSDHYRDGVWWVPLAPLRDPQLVLETAGQVVGAKGDLATHLGDASMLLLFDNFEQVVAAASDVAGLLTSCPNVDLLVTSREPLHVTGEHEYPVPPLAQDDAAALFVTRATAVRPDFEPDDAVAEICGRLDNLPLAIELAAARVKAFEPRQILHRLEQRLPLLTGGARDLPERQRTLRATIEWSHDLLSPDERRLFARLGVFRGGCTLEAAEEVVDAEWDMVQSLVDKSLVRRRDDRYWMLETIREFATERLEASDEQDAIRQRHIQYFGRLAGQAHVDLWAGRSLGPWLDRLERDHDNLRAALDRLEASGEHQQVLEIAATLRSFWYLRGHLVEGRRRIESALEADPAPTLSRAKALNALAALSMDSGDPSVMKQAAEAALTLFRRHGEAMWTANSLHLLALASVDLGDPGDARTFLEEADGILRDLDESYQRLMVKHVLAFTTRELGDVGRSRELHEEELREATEVGNDRVRARALAQLGVIAVDEGRIADAFPLLEEAYRIDRELGERVETAIDIARLARAVAHSGRFETAARVLSAAEAYRREIGAIFRPWARTMNEETLEMIRAQLDEASFDAGWEAGASLGPDEAVALALEEPA